MILYPDTFRLITKIRLDHPSWKGIYHFVRYFPTLGLKNFTLKAKWDVFAIAKLQKRVKKNRGADCSIQL